MGERVGLGWVVGVVTGAVGAEVGEVVEAGGGVDGEEDGDTVGWSAMERRAAAAGLSRGEKRGTTRAPEASILSIGVRDRESWE